LQGYFLSLVSMCLGLWFSLLSAAGTFVQVSVVSRLDVSYRQHRQTAAAVVSSCLGSALLCGSW
jgi:hypothetical protein